MHGAAAAPCRTVSWAPLALTLGLHLLLVLAWLLQPARESAPPPGERETMLVMVRPPPAPLSPPRTEHRAEPRAEPRLARRPRAQTPVRPQVPAQQAPTPEVTSEAQPITPPVEAGPATAPLPGELLATSRRMAGRIDRELSSGGSPISAEPERKWERFAGMMASARTSAGTAVSLDSYTAPDGVTVYRKTVGERVRCYVSGSVGGIGPADGRSAGNIPCPTGVRWTRQ